MAAFPAPPERWNARATALIAVLSDPARRDRTVAALLVAYTVVWTAYGVLAKGSQDIHFDMAELAAWGQEHLLGTNKHPPLGSWLVEAWFALFPPADWSYYLLAMATAGLALWIAWKLSGDYLDGEKRVVGLALLTLVPFFNFHALKFNVNTILMPLWAATTLWFLRAFKTRSWMTSALAGVGAGASMLGKYWSICLLAGLGVAALGDARRSAYFRSAAPWISAAVGALVLAPHVVWLAGSGFVTFGYASEMHSAESVSALAAKAGLYLLGALAYVAAPLVILAMAAQFSWPAVRDSVWSSDPDRRLAAATFWGPLLAPLPVAVAGKKLLTPLWTMSSWTLLPVVLLSSPMLRLRLGAAQWIVVVAVAFPLAMLAASPAIGWFIHRAGVIPSSAHARLLAAEVERLWQQATPRPLRLVGGDTNLQYAARFYLPGRPHSAAAMAEGSPQSLGEALTRDGIALVCLADDAACTARIKAESARHPDARATETELVRTYWGAPGKPSRYVIVILAPPDAESASPRR